MRRIMTLTALFAGGLFLAACADSADSIDEDVTSEMDMAAEAAPSEMDVAAGDAAACYIRDVSLAEAQDRPSPLSQITFSVGGHDGLLCYGAPSARGRDIMGGLLIYGQPERIGANEPTTIHLTGPASIGGVALDAGSYSIYAIANEGEWEFFINSNWERWGVPIDDTVRSADVGSFTVTPETMDDMVEMLTYSFEPTDDGTMGDIVMEWEHTRLKFHAHPAS